MHFSASQGNSGWVMRKKPQPFKDVSTKGVNPYSAPEAHLTDTHPDSAVPSGAWFAFFRGMAFFWMLLFSALSVWGIVQNFDSLQVWSAQKSHKGIFIIIFEGIVIVAFVKLLQHRKAFIWIMEAAWLVMVVGHFSYKYLLSSSTPNRGDYILSVAFALLTLLFCGPAYLKYLFHERHEKMIAPNRSDSDGRMK